MRIVTIVTRWKHSETSTDLYDCTGHDVPRTG